MRKKLITLGLIFAIGASLTACGSNSGSSSASASSGAIAVSSAEDGKKDKEKIELTNVSYDPTRELYAAYNEVFAKH